MISNHRHPLFSCRAPRRPVLGLALGTWLVLTPVFAEAACTLVSSTASADLGIAVVNTLPPAPDVAGYRLMGVRKITVSGACDTPRASTRLAFTGLHRIAGKPLVKWGESGALVFRIERATVGGVPVPFTVTGTPAGRVSSVELTEDATVDLDLQGIAPDARKTFSVQLNLIGLVPNVFVAQTKSRIESRFDVRLTGSN